MGLQGNRPENPLQAQHQLNYRKQQGTAFSTINFKKKNSPFPSFQHINTVLKGGQRRKISQTHTNMHVHTHMPTGVLFRGQWKNMKLFPSVSGGPPGRGGRAGRPGVGCRVRGREETQRSNRRRRRRNGLGGPAPSPQAAPAPWDCCLGDGGGILRNAWSRYPSLGLRDGAEGGGWLFSFCFFLSYSAD